MRRFWFFSLIAVGVMVVGLGIAQIEQHQALRNSKADRALEIEHGLLEIEHRLEDKTQEQEIIRATLETPSASYNISVPRGSNVFDLMVAAAAQSNNFSFSGREFSGIGFFVEQINGLRQDEKEGMYWIYYINGQTAPIGVSQYKIKENDIITWRYEKEH